MKTDADSGVSVDLFQIAKETRHWCFLLNTISGVVSFSFAAALFVNEPSWRNLFVSFASLIFVIALSISMKSISNDSIKKLHMERIRIEKISSPSSLELKLLKDILDALDYADKNFLKPKKVFVFLFGYVALGAVVIFNGLLVIP